MRIAWSCGIAAMLVCFASIEGCGSSEEADDTTKTLADGVHGPQRVPAGSTLEAEHEGEAIVESDETGAAVIVETEPGKTTTVRGVRIISHGTVGMLVVGGGAFVGEDLSIECDRGVGLVAEGPSDFHLSDTVLQGDITEARVPTLAFPLDGSEAAILGMALSRVASADLGNVDVRGFGGFGAVVVQSDVTWNRGNVAGNVGVGVIIENGHGSLSDVAIRDTWAGQVGLAIPAYGAVVSKGGLFETANVKIVDNDGIGVLQDNARAIHRDLIVTGNLDVGLWTQHAMGTLAEPALVVEGSATSLSGNRGGGLFVIESGGIDIRDAGASGALERNVVSTESVLATMADGVQITTLMGDLSLRNLRLDDNARVGLLLNGPRPASASVTMEGIQIGGLGAYGMIIQDTFGAPPDGAVTRTPALVSADEGFSGTLALAAALEGVVSLGTMAETGLVGGDGLVGADGTKGGSHAVQPGGL